MVINSSIYKKNNITILEPKYSHQKLYKTFTFEDGKLIKGAYDMIKYVKTFDYEIVEVKDFLPVLEILSEGNSAIIRGHRIDNKAEYVRRLCKTKIEDDVEIKAEFQDLGRDWLAIDVDDIELEVENYFNKDSINKYIQEQLPECFHNVSYVYHFSGSSGISFKGELIKSGLACHLFFCLDRPLTSKEVKHWLKDEIIKGVVDGSHYNPVQLLYCANSIIEKDQLNDYFKDNSVSRLGEVTKRLMRCKVPEITVPTTIIYSAPTLNLTDDNQHNAILVKLNSIGSVDYPKWRDIGWSMKSNGFSLADFESVSANLRADGSVDWKAQYETLWKSGSGDVSLGVVINIIKEQCNEDTVTWLPQINKEFKKLKGKELMNKLIKELRK